MGHMILQWVPWLNVPRRQETIRLDPRDGMSPPFLTTIILFERANNRGVPAKLLEGSSLALVQWSRAAKAPVRMFR